MKISACVIAKNEAATIGRCLQSLSPVADELIVVDTGSTDATAAIAAALGAKIYTYPWRDDFAAAKNFALGKASGDWVIFIDADEYISGPAVRNLAALIARYGRKYDVLLTKLVNIDADNGDRVLDELYVARLFKNTGAISYEGRIHEQLQKAGGTLKVRTWPDDDLIVYHTGYSAGRSVAKARRNIELLTREIAGGNRPERWYSYLADAYMGVDDYAAAARYARLAVQSGPPRDTYASRPYRTLVECLKHLPDTDEELAATLAAAIAAFPELPDFYAEYGLFLYQRRNYAAAREQLERALRLSESYRGVEQSQLKQSAPLARRLLAEITQRLEAERPMPASAQAAEPDPILYNDAFNKAARKLQQYLVGLLLFKNADGNWRELTPEAFQRIIDGYHDGTPLDDGDFAPFRIVLLAIAEQHDVKLLNSYLRLTAQFSYPLRVDVLKLLAARRLFAAMAPAASSIAPELPRDDGEGCYYCGLAYYYGGELERAAELLELARRLGAEKRELDSYLVWIRERRC